MKYLAVVILFFCCEQLQAQLTVRNSNDPIALAQKIVGQGVTILNPVFKGAPVSAGFLLTELAQLELIVELFLQPVG